MKWVSRVLFRIAQFCARRARGRSYSLDQTIPVRSVLALSFQHASGLLRGIFRLVALPPMMVFVGRKVVLRNRHLISIGNGCSLGDYVALNGLSRRGITLGKGVSLGPHTIIEATGVVSNMGEGCKIGDNSGFGAFSFIGAAGGVEIGSDVIGGQYVSFHSENHHFDNIEAPIRHQGVSRKGIVIGDNCWIGAKATFLDGARVGSGSVIAAGAVVKGEIPPRSIAAGVPARVIANREEV